MDQIPVSHLALLLCGRVFNQKYIFSSLPLLVQNVHLLNYGAALSMCCCVGSHMKRMLDKIDSLSFPSWLWQISLLFLIHGSVPEIQTIEVVNVTVMASSVITVHMVKFCFIGVRFQFLKLMYCHIEPKIFIMAKKLSKTMHIT